MKSFIIIDTSAMKAYLAAFHPEEVTDLMNAIVAYYGRSHGEFTKIWQILNEPQQQAVESIIETNEELDDVSRMIQRIQNVKESQKKLERWKEKRNER